MKRKRLVFLILFCLCLTACAGGGADTPPPDVAVTASFYPLYIAALNVIGDTPGVALTMLAPPDTGCLHDYQLRPQDLAALERCDLLIVNGGGLEVFLDHVMGKYPALPLCTASDGVAFVPYEQAAGAGGESERTPGEDNPHAWVSAGLFLQYVKNIRDGLIEADPSHAEGYTRNAERYAATLEALAAEMHESLDGLPHKDIVTFHEAVSYFADEFGLHIVAVIEREPGQSPSPPELAETIEIVRRTGVKALFAEPQYTPAAAETIARETGATVYLLDPVVTGALTADAYETAMRGNTETLRTALGEA